MLGITDKYINFRNSYDFFEKLILYICRLN